jgi:pyruvate dehydrogenase E1 component
VRGFLVGATAGRTTLNGEGLQHQDGQSQLTAYTCPHVVAYDPAFGYELAAIVRHGIARMHDAHEDVIFYLTVYNEVYRMRDSPDGAEEGILRGLYRLTRSTVAATAARAHLLASGSIVGESLAAQRLLEHEYGVATDVWSVTSFQQLYRDGAAVERWNWLNPDHEPRQSWIGQCLSGEEGAFVVASDFVKALPDSIARWFPRPPVSLGTDGFGRSESRSALRRYFEVDAATMAWTALVELVRQGRLDHDVLARARQRLNVDGAKASPLG